MRNEECGMKKADYKMTEIGPIPEDWEVKRLGEVCEKIRNGYGYDFREQGIYPMSRIETISSGTINYQRVVKITEEPPVEYKLEVGDILYSHINSLPYIGNVAQYDGSEILYHGMNLLLLRPTEMVNYAYLKYLLKSDPMRNMAKSAAKVAINQASISTRELAQFPIALPPLAEQRRIAEALSDVDELIAALDKVIEKKRAVKQGAMQEMLGMRNAECGMRNVPRRRLPGFTGEWVKKRLGDVADFVTSTISVEHIDMTWYIGTENMLSDKAGVVKNTVPVPYKNVREYVRGDVLISNIRPYLKKVWFADRNGGCSTDVLVIRTRDYSVCVPAFLMMLVSHDEFFDYAMANAIGTKMPRGDKKILVDFSVMLPQTITEQQAIAEVLSDMDAEIAALEAKRAKYKSVKQGMMQELLTGRTRMV